MASRRSLAPVALAAGLFSCGGVAAAAGAEGMWGLLAGSTVAAGWLGASAWWMVMRPRPSPALPATHDDAEQISNRLLLDVAPTPMLAIEGVKVRVLNRAGRRLFATDDRVLPAPDALIDPACDRLHHEGRHWRIDRVTLADAAASRMVVALIDVEQEERIAEARASAEMIHVLGHELLNGLAPIASLAESGEAALASPAADPDLLREIFGTLARRAEGLQRFTEAYRSLARLPELRTHAVPVSELAVELERLFAGRFPSIPLVATSPSGLRWPLDRDQMMQAVWALLQNAAEAVDAGAVGAGRVWLSVDATPAGLAIDVEDDGPGVAHDDALRIFRPFHTTKPEGTGVGLSLARQIAVAHGGSLTLEPGGRTTFRLRLPAQA